MRIINFLFEKIIPTRDTIIIQLRKKNKELRKRNLKLEEEVFLLKEDKQIPIKFYDDNIEEEILRNLKVAKKDICIAMAWFSSQAIIDELRKLKLNGVSIKMIICEDKNNNKLKQLIPFNRLKVIKKKGRNLMHNKYCIIDSKVVIDGSYNWSDNARKNIEHIIIVNNEQVAEMYKKSFYKIFHNSRYYGNYEIYELLG